MAGEVKVGVSVTLPVELRERLDRFAHRHGLSRAAALTLCLVKGLDHAELWEHPSPSATAGATDGER